MSMEINTKNAGTRDGEKCFNCGGTNTKHLGLGYLDNLPVCGEIYDCQDCGEQSFDCF